MIEKKLVKKKPDYNTKKPEYFNKINALIDSGKYTHSMDDALNKVHKKLGTDK